MDTTLILAQGAVVIIGILLGVRTGGIGRGLWGLVGMAVLVFSFHLPPGEPPMSSMLIILAVITAASTMQAGVGSTTSWSRQGDPQAQSRLHRIEEGGLPWVNIR